MMSFYEWMITKYDGQDSPRGDLAQDMKYDETFPTSSDKEVLLNYLYNQHACTACLDVFKRCYRDYRKQVEEFERK